MDYRTILVRVVANVGYICLNRPAQKNAISMLMAREIIAACDALEADRSVSCIIVSGAGDSFCAGGDIKEAGALETAETEALIDSVSLWNKMGYRLKSVELPTIAALHGHVLGGGFLLAMCCDIRIAADDANIGVLLTKPRIFQDKEVVGSAADMGLTWILPRMVGTGLAAELMFTGDSIPTGRAERIGLLNHVVPRADLMAKAEELAAKFAQGSRLRLRFTKRAIHMASFDRLATHMDFEAALQSHMIRAADE